MARDLERYARCRKNAKKSKCGLSRNQCSTMPEDCVVVDDEEFKDITINARRKLEIQMPAAMPCKTQREKCRETCRLEKKCKTKGACVVEADVSMRLRMAGAVRKHHEDQIAGKGMNSLISCTNLFLCLKQWNIRCKASSGERMGKLEKIPAWQLTKVKNKSEVIADARNKGRTVHFSSLMDLCHLKNSELEPQFQKYKGRVVLRGVTVKDDSGSYAVFTEQRSSAPQMTAAKVMDIFQDYQDAQDKQKTQHQLTIRLKWKRHRLIFP